MSERNVCKYYSCFFFGTQFSIRVPPPPPPLPSHLLLWTQHLLPKSTPNNKESNHTGKATDKKRTEKSREHSYYTRRMWLCCSYKAHLYHTKLQLILHSFEELDFLVQEIGTLVTKESTNCLLVAGNSSGFLNAKTFSIVQEYLHLCLPDDSPSSERWEAS